jgi:hypothetical protein
MEMTTLYKKMPATIDIKTIKIVSVFLIFTIFFYHYIKNLLI